MESSHIDSTLIPTMGQLQSMKTSDLEAQQIQMPDERIVHMLHDYIIYMCLCVFIQLHESSGFSVSTRCIALVKYEAFLGLLYCFHNKIHVWFHVMDIYIYLYV